MCVCVCVCGLWLERLAVTFQSCCYGMRMNPFSVHDDKHCFWQVAGKRNGAAIFCHPINSSWKYVICIVCVFTMDASETCQWSSGKVYSYAVVVIHVCAFFWYATSHNKLTMCFLMNVGLITESWEINFFSDQYVLPVSPSLALPPQPPKYIEKTEHGSQTIFTGIDQRGGTPRSQLDYKDANNITVWSFLTPASAWAHRTSERTMYHL